ncbi:MAG: cyclic 2,3-diphosphoglycerate synthase [Geobacteraceae bacterium]|nr:cyclic 2,3-diphosphoglycerate synthase [Geobacteraceae bacterium]
MKRTRVIIMGAAGRDFHNFNVCFRHKPEFQVVAFTAAQIPYIANRRYPPSLAGTLYPRGIPVHPEAELELLIRKHRVDQVVFAYSDIAYGELMHRASRVLALGAEFRLLGPDATMLKSSKPVIAVCAVRTGCGKSEVTRYLCGILREQGIRPVVIRHPMPYGNLAEQEVERFENFDDLALQRCTIEEREEFEPLLQERAVVYAGVDYGKIIRRAEREGEVIIWDGGNNDFPFLCPDLEITVADPLRPGDEVSYYPGEVNLRRAAVVVINKANAADPEKIRELELTVAAVNPHARVIRTASAVSVADPAAVRGKRVLVIEDGPTITHGNMASGAGLAAARQYGAGQVIDPRPHATGSLAEAFRAYPHIGPVLPALGYRPEQIEELRRTIEAVPCDLVLCATPIDLNRVMPLSRPVVRVRYDIAEEADAPLKALVSRFIAALSP